MTLGMVQKSLYRRRFRYEGDVSERMLRVSNCCTLSPLVTLLSQSGRGSSSGKRVWFTESRTVLVIVFSLTLYLFILFLI